LTEVERVRLKGALERLASHTCAVTGGRRRAC
jgi:hypothetical protein